MKAEKIGYRLRRRLRTTSRLFRIVTPSRRRSRRPKWTGKEGECVEQASLLDKEIFIQKMFCQFLTERVLLYYQKFYENE